MLYTEILVSLIILLLMFLTVYPTIEAQKKTYEDILVMEKAQLMAYDKLWDINEEELFKDGKTEVAVPIEVEVDGKLVEVTFYLKKYDRK